MKSLRLCPALVVCFVGLFGLVSCGEKAPAPSIRVESLTTAGKFVDLTDYRGKVVMIDFWATWCGPCLEAMPKVQELYSKYKGQGFEVMGVTTEDRSVVAKFFRNRPLPYPLFLDGDGTANRAFNIKFYPSAVLIDRAGNVVYVGLFNDDGFMPALDKALGKA